MMNNSNNYLHSNAVLRNYICSTTLLMTMLVLLRKKQNEERKRIKQRRTRTLWARKWLQRRDCGRGISNLVFDELAVEDPNSFKNYTRMSVNTFQDLLEKVQPHIEREDTFFRDSISARTRYI